MRTKTECKVSRTPISVMPWGGHKDEVMAFQSGLSKTATIDRGSLAPYTPVGEPAEEGDVRSACSTQFSAMRHIAREANIQSFIAGSGQGTTRTRADFVVRDRLVHEAEAAQRQRSSAAVTAVIEIKGTWQFRISRGDTWDDIARDPAKLKDVMLALEQVSLLYKVSACTIMPSG